MRTAVVTGAAKGIGKAIADRLVNDGYNVIRIDINGDVDKYLDVSNPDAIKKFFDESDDVDVLVNCAGIAGPSTAVIETDDTAWQKTIDINLSGTFYMCRGAAAKMRQKGWGRIINFASIAGKEGNQNQGAYSASKGGVIALTKSLGKELATSGILVNVVAPGLIDTDIVSDMSEENRERSLSKIPMGRMGTVEEVAALTSWLASDQIAFSTGAIYDISGGRATY